MRGAWSFRCNLPLTNNKGLRQALPSICCSSPALPALIRPGDAHRPSALTQSKIDLDVGGWGGGAYVEYFRGDTAGSVSGDERHGHRDTDGQMEIYKDTDEGSEKEIKEVKYTDRQMRGQSQRLHWAIGIKAMIPHVLISIMDIQQALVQVLWSSTDLLRNAAPCQIFAYLAARKSLAPIRALLSQSRCGLY